jgi:hypothetical protein
VEIEDHISEEKTPIGKEEEREIYIYIYSTGVRVVLFCSVHVLILYL